MPWSAPASWRPFWPPPGWRPRARRRINRSSFYPPQRDAAPRPLRVPKAICASRRAASRASSGKARRPKLPQYLYDHTTPRLLATQKSSAYIKIAEGCDHPCSFCVIPNLRGKFRSRRFASVVAEAEQLVAQGVREITLIGQDTTCYGEDLGMKDGLAQLLDSLARIPGLKWLRFLYAYPNKITGRLLETIARHDNHLQVSRHASAARLRPGVEEHAARRQRRHFSQNH